MIESLISHHCSSKASKNRQELDLLTRLASHLKEKLDAGMTSVAEPLESILLSIADMNRTAAVGARVRARAKWAEEGESSSRYFFRLEKKRGADQWCSALRMEDGTIVSGISDIVPCGLRFIHHYFLRSPPIPETRIFSSSIWSPPFRMKLLRLAMAHCRRMSYLLLFMEWREAKLQASMVPRSNFIFRFGISLLHTYLRF